MSPKTQEPVGREIAEKARGIRLDEKRSVHGKKGGKKAKFTAADLTHVKTLDDMEEGQVIGVLDTELEGDETRLPSGKYNVFVAKVNGDWHGYAESGGRVVAKAARATVTRHRVGERKTAGSFSPRGWCFRICVVPFWGSCLVSIRICF